MSQKSPTSSASRKGKQKKLLAALLKERGAAVEKKKDVIVPAPDDHNKPFPLNWIQQAYVAGRSSDFDLGNIATHGYQEFEVAGVDPARYQSAWDRLIKRHDTLRSVVSDESTQVVIGSPPHYELPILDLRGMDEELRDQQLLKVREEMSHQVIPLNTWPMFDVRMTLLDEDVTRLHFSFDALLMDGSSFPVLMQDIRWLYEHPEDELPPLSLTFRDYVLAMQRKEKEAENSEDAEYWRNRLTSLAPAPEFSLRKKLTDVEKPEFVRMHAPWSLERWKSLEKIATAKGLTATTLLLTAFCEVLRRWNRHSSFSLNVSFFNRIDMHEEVEKIIGDFTDIMLFSVEHLPNSTLLERAQNLQQRFWEDMQHRSFSGVQVIRELIRSKGGAGSAVMPVVFTNLLKVGDVSRGATLDGQPFKLRHSISQTPQVLIDLHVYQYGDVIGINWDTVEEVFPKGQLQEMFAVFNSLLERMESEPEIWNEQKVISLPTDQTLRHEQTNSTEADVPTALLHELVANASEAFPENAAVITPDRTVTHKELRDRALSLGAELRAQGVTPNTLVAVFMEKGWEQVVAVLGILEAGAAYLPLDAEFPSERIHQILQNSEAQIVLTQSWLFDRLVGCEDFTVVSVDTFRSASPVKPLESVQLCDDLAYVIYTSGSTGMPKGVMISHRAAANTILDINNRFDVGPKDRMLALSDLNFDLSVYDLFGVLGAGGAIVMTAPDKTREPAHWLELMQKHDVTLWNTVPMLLQMMIAHADDSSLLSVLPLRLALLSGDWIPLELPEKYRRIWPDSILAALGGATEASIWSNIHVVEGVPEHWNSIPYGKPLTNQRFYILNDSMEECPDLIPGNLFIAGEGLAQGYWKDEAQTRAAFINHPVTNEPLYRTGDMGRWLSEGIIEFLGRMDAQVKIGGYRIELGEVETALSQCDNVQEAAARVVGDGAHSRSIIGYVVTKTQSESFAVETLFAALRERLPRYMIPAVIIQLDALPLSPNGKVNRKSLPLPIGNESEIDETEVSETEHAILDEWKKLVGNGQIKRTDNFFELGGNSLIAVQTLSMIKRRFSVDVSLREFFNVPTAAELAALVVPRIQDNNEVLEEGCI